MSLNTSVNECEDLQEIAVSAERLKKALDIYEERWDWKRFRDAAPSLRGEMDDTIEAVEDRLREFQRIEDRRPPDPLSLIKEATEDRMGKQI